MAPLFAESPRLRFRRGSIREFKVLCGGRNQATPRQGRAHARLGKALDANPEGKVPGAAQKNHTLRGEYFSVQERISLLRVEIGQGRRRSIKRKLFRGVSLGFIAPVLLAAFLTGSCARKPQSPEPRDLVTLTLWTDGDDEEMVRVREEARQFESANPGFSVKVVRQSPQELQDRLEAAVSGGGELPDLAPAALKARYVAAGAVEPLDGYLRPEERQDYYSAALEGYTLDGKLYGIPSGVEFPFLVLNLELFREAEVPPPSDGQWMEADFARVARRLTLDRNRDGKPEVYGLGFYLVGGFHEFWPFLYSDGGRLFEGDPPRYALDGPAGVSGLKKLVELKAASTVWPGSGREPPQAVWAAFAGPSREIAVLPVGTWAIPLLENSRWKTDFAVAEFPAGEGGKPVTVARVTGYTVFRQRDPEKAKMAFRLARALTSPEEQRTVARRKGIMPASRSAGNPFPDDPHLTRVWKMTSFAVALPGDQVVAEVLDRIQRQVELALLGAAARDRQWSETGPFGVSGAQGGFRLSRLIRIGGTPT